jgi:hypothetical protein
MRKLPPQGTVVPENVLAKAKEHVESLRPVEGFVWRLAKGQRVATGWYFDYEAERLQSNPPGPGSGFGYAPRFVVADDGSIRVARWSELSEVRRSLPQK